ncbi:FcoT family thioesterase [Nocardia arthritidis]|uniref:(2E)-enoyl-[ACP] glycyltransferase n=1 Tax=Nocardia arthritidis TaxID=228602 RepID=A0A6G9YER9_9NOCA|nr:FcoT family thioesterase [Nocardia arthritidis]QIS11721.1 hypothetical protein F5544_19265 [Nocardia arthritidis]
MRYPNDPALLGEVLRCYQPHCRYLGALRIESDGEKTVGTADFEITESCYIDATGHLNSVEVNICYNQMLYQSIAMLVRNRVGAVFGAWTMDEFRRRQLPDILITRFESAFRRPIEPRRFHGEITIDGVAQRVSGEGAEYIALDTGFRCWDDAGGACAGAVRIAVVGADLRLAAAR